MGIKIKHKDPKSTDFSPSDIVVNVKDGTLFYKSTTGLFKVQGDNVNTTNVELVDHHKKIMIHPFYFNFPSSDNNVEKYIPSVGAGDTGLEYPYNMFISPFKGKVLKLQMYYSAPVDTGTFKVYQSPLTDIALGTAGTDPILIETQVLTSMPEDAITEVKFLNASFAKNRAVHISQQVDISTGGVTYVGGSITFEFDTST